MMRSRWFRLALAGMVMVAVAAIYVSLQSRSREIEDPPARIPLLPADITRKSTEFEFSQLKGGKPVFKVMASTSTLNRAGEHRLEQVTMLRYDDSGQATDAVEGSGAVYRPQRKEIEFEGNVVIHLFDGSKIYADWAGADLEKEVVYIRDSFSFINGGVTGQGGALRYEIPAQVIRIDKSVSLKFQQGSSSGSARAGTAVYRMKTGEVNLGSGAALDRLGIRLRGETLILNLTEKQEIQRAEAVGGAQLETGPERRFSGERIRVEPDSDPAGGYVVYVLGGNSGVETAAAGTPGGARFQQLGEGTAFELTADRMRAWVKAPEGDRVGTSYALDRLLAERQVALVSPALGLEEGKADRLQTQFDAAGREPRLLDLQGGVRLVRRPQGREQEVIQADRVRLTLAGSRQMESAEATGHVSVDRTSALGEEHLTARDAVSMEFGEGILTRAVGRSQCRLTSIREGNPTVVRAPTIVATFRTGLIDQVRAAQGVELEMDAAAGRRFSRSDVLLVRYREGKLAEVVQTGACRQWQQDVSSSLELLSERTELDPVRRLLTATGKERPRLRTSGGESAAPGGQPFETTARAFELNADGSQVRAIGQVESVAALGGGPVIVTAESMEADPGSGAIVYTGNPRLIQGANLIGGRTIRLSGRGQQLEVLGEVTSTLVAGEGPAEQTYKVRAERLLFRSEDRDLFYEGRVELKSERLEVQAPRMRVVFEAEAPDQFNRLEAEGGVEILEGSRRWKGERATYYRQDDRVVINPKPE